MTVPMETVRMAKSRPRKDQSECSDLPCHIINWITNQVRGPYCKLRTELFSLWFMTQAGSAPQKRAGHKSKRKKRGSVIYSTDRENEVSKIFIISLLGAWQDREWFQFTRNGLNFWRTTKAKQVNLKSFLSFFFNKTFYTFTRYKS